MSQLKKIREQASALQKKVLLPEAEFDIRVLKAAARMINENIATPVLIGDREVILEQCKKHSIKLPDDLMIEPVDNPETEVKKYQFFEHKLAHKNPSPEQIESLCKNPLFTGGWLLEKGVADAAVAGSIAATSEVILAAIRTVGVAEGSASVSSIFLMEMPNGNVYTYADCAVVPYPNAEQLASIAIDAGSTHTRLTGSLPSIAFLSFSTKGSAKHERVELVQQAFAIASQKNNEWVMDGELQFDAAFIPDIATSKAPHSPVKGNANVFIFPNLDAANIGYKITERLAGASATGPILQGLAKPYMDLSRGCSVDDIVNTACVGMLLGV